MNTPIDEAACPSSGLLTSRVHQRTRQRLRDVPFDRLVMVWRVTKRGRCLEPRCARASFTDWTAQVRTWPGSPPG